MVFIYTENFIRHRSFDAVGCWSGVLLDPVEVGSDTGIEGGLIWCASNSITHNAHKKNDVVINVQQRSTCRQDENLPIFPSQSEVFCLPESPWHVSLFLANEQICVDVQFPYPTIESVASIKTLEGRPANEVSPLKADFSKCLPTIPFRYLPAEPLNHFVNKWVSTKFIRKTCWLNTSRKCQSFSSPDQSNIVGVGVHVVTWVWDECRNSQQLRVRRFTSYWSVMFSNDQSQRRHISS